MMEFSRQFSDMFDIWLTVAIRIGILTSLASLGVLLGIGRLLLAEFGLPALGWSGRRASCPSNFADAAQAKSEWLIEPPQRVLEHMGVDLRIAMRKLQPAHRNAGFDHVPAAFEATLLIGLQRYPEIGGPG